MEAFDVACWVIFAILVWGLNLAFWNLWRARQLRKHFEKQGIRGPPFRHVVGNLPEIKRLGKAVPKFESNFNAPSKFRVLPDLCSFYEKYGNVFVHELGSITRVAMVDPEMARQVLITRSSYYTKVDLTRKVLKGLLGNGVVVSEGDFWRQQRRILNPAFRVEYLKGLMKHMSNAGEELAQRWHSRIQEHGSHTEIDAHGEMAMLTLDIIARASFGASVGSASATQGAAAFECLDQLLNYGLRNLNSYRRLIPGYSLLPTRENLHMQKNEQFVNELLRDIIQTRWAEKKESKELGHDLLGMMLEAVERGSPTMTMDQLLDECKTIFFAGHATTAIVLTWSLVMLSIHQDWQKRARDEVLAVFEGAEVLTAEHLAKLEIVSLIINETMRLFPPVSTVSRQCQQAHTIGDVSVVPGTIVMIPLVLLLQSEEIWGKDVYEFKPERFKNKNTKELPGFMVFGAGPRMCLGMNFALMEAKVLLALMLKKFSFSLSSDYRHAPGSSLSMKPALGAPLIVKELDS